LISRALAGHGKSTTDADARIADSMAVHYRIPQYYYIQYIVEFRRRQQRSLFLEQGTIPEQPQPEAI
jgi:hypothetical protein